MPTESRSGYGMLKGRLKGAALRDAHRRVLMRNEHLDAAALHGGDEPVGGGLDDGEGAVVAGDDGSRPEEALDGERRRLRPHGETVADRHDYDLRLVDLGDERHVAEDVGV